MKKIIFITVIILIFIININAGNAGNTMAFDILLGTSICSAFGTLLSLPSFMQGGSQNSTVLYVGASYGALIGAGLGFIYGIYDIIRNTQERKELQKQTGILYNNNDICLKIENFNLSITKNF